MKIWLVSLIGFFVFAGCRDNPPKATPKVAAPLGHVAPSTSHARNASFVSAAHPAKDLAEDSEAAVLDAERLGTPAAWDLAADKLARLLAACTIDCRDLAVRLLKARRTALQLEPKPDESQRKTAEDGETPLFPLEPTPLPARVEAMIDAADELERLAASDDPELAGARFIAATAYNRYGWNDESAMRFEKIISSHPASELSEYAANLLLENLNRTGQYEELKRWARKLLADDAFMAGKSDLRETLIRIVAAAGPS
ncbi:MAG: hypothetical protein AB7O24_00110 [Kofleriaceae bacterium]